MVFNPEGTALFVVVCNRHCIYKVPYNALTHTFGEPELFAGGWDESGYVNGSGVTARFDNPRQPAFDQDGNMFVPEMDDILFVKLLQQVRCLCMLDYLVKQDLRMVFQRRLDLISLNV